MRSRLNCLETSYSTNGEYGLITKVADSLVNDGFNVRILSDTRNGLITINQDVLKIEEPFNLIFTKQDCLYCFIVIKGEGEIKKCKNLQGILIDADSLEVIGGRRLFLNEKEEGKELRTHIKKYGKSIKLHRYLCGDPDACEVDHITHRSHICTKEQLRVCSSDENKLNKPFRTKINYQRRTFKMSRINPTEEDIQAVKEAGHIIERVACDVKGVEGSGYSIYSKVFDSIEELYKDLNELENRFHGQYRYNPIYAFDDVEICGGIKYSGLIWTYLYMQVKLLGLNENDFVKLRTEFLKDYCPDMCDYYGVV